MTPEEKMSPISWKGLYVSVVASPWLWAWPVDCRLWLYDRCTIQPTRPTDDPQPMFSKAQLGLTHL